MAHGLLGRVSAAPMLEEIMSEMVGA